LLVIVQARYSRCFGDELTRIKTGRFVGRAASQLRLRRRVRGLGRRRLRPRGFAASEALDWAAAEVL